MIQAYLWLDLATVIGIRGTARESRKRDLRLGAGSDCNIASCRARARGGERGGLATIHE